MFLPQNLTLVNKWLLDNPQAPHRPLMVPRNMTDNLNKTHWPVFFDPPELKGFYRVGTFMLILTRK